LNCCASVAFVLAVAFIFIVSSPAAHAIPTTYTPVVLMHGTCVAPLCINLILFE
jgi:hypothetical protein